jgi:hypothetical protein
MIWVSAIRLYMAGLDSGGNNVLRIEAQPGDSSRIKILGNNGRSGV